jgi:REP element-mobilizing transposase RayT
LDEESIVTDYPLAYFITWTTYGTWLPGDERGWVEAGKPGIQAPDAVRKDEVERRLAFDPVYLDPAQRSVVHDALEEHAEFRGWELRARNTRTNHVHVAVSAREDGAKVRDRFKAWCSRRLNERFGKRPIWWTRWGSVRYVWKEHHLENVFRYVVDGQ